MKNQITLTITGKEALTLISGEIVPSVQKKVINALKGSNVRPIGARAAAVAKTRKPTSKNIVTAPASV
jgi:hypothetical protein